MLLNAMNDHSLSWKPQHSTCWVARKKNCNNTEFKEKITLRSLTTTQSKPKQTKKKSPLYSI